jgi:hypothetical protein
VSVNRHLQVTLSPPHFRPTLTPAPIGGGNLGSTVLPCLRVGMWGEAAMCRPKWWDQIMSRVIAVVACGFTVAACSASMPSLNFLSSSPPTEALRFESEPPGAEVKTSLGQTCRTPCELTVQLAPELSATFALNGYQPQTISVRSEPGSGFSSPRLAPNPVYVELRPAPAAPTTKKRVKKKPPTEARRSNSPVASAAPSAPPPMSAAAPTSSPAPEAAASATNYPWPAPPATR